MGRKWVVFFLVSWAAASCAHLPQPARSPHVGAEGPIGACAQFFAALDQEVTQVGARDPGAFRVAGYPYLRVDRFLASFRKSVETDEAFEAWLDRMQALDREGRHVEIANLPADRHEWLRKSFSAPDLETRASACGETLRSADFIFEHLSFTRFENQVLTQLNYVIWFPSRPSTGPFDILAGFLDGLNYRVTLDLTRTASCRKATAKSAGSFGPRACCPPGPCASGVATRWPLWANDTLMIPIS